MKNKWFWIVIYILSLAVCALFIYIVPSLAGFLEKTYIAEPGEIELSCETSAFIIRDETVYTADKAGSVKKLIGDGRLVKAGTAIVEISGEGKEEIGQGMQSVLENLGKAAVTAEAGTSGTAGYISYTVDGAERRLNRKTVRKVSRATLEKYADARPRKTSSGKCAKGEPVFRTTKNGEWWLVFFVSKEDAKTFALGDTVTINIGDDTAAAVVKRIRKLKKTDEARITLKCNVMVGDYLNMRQTDLKVITESAKGLIIDNKSIVKKNKRKGVLVKNKLGENVFVPILVKASDGEKSAVCEDIYMDEGGNFVETIKVHDEIVASPDEKQVEESL